MGGAGRHLGRAATELGVALLFALVSLAVVGCSSVPEISPYEVLDATAAAELEGLRARRSELPIEERWQGFVAFLESNPHHVPTHRLFQDDMIEAGLRERVREQYWKWYEQSQGAGDFLYSLFATLSARLVDDDREAVRLLENAIGIDDDNYWAWYGIGFLHRRQQRRLRAVEAFEHAIDRRPSWPDPYLEAAEVELEREHYPESARFYRSYLELRPQDADARFNYARLLHLHLDQKAEAGRIYRDLITQNAGGLPLDRLIDVFNNLAHLETLEGDYETAEALYERILGLDSSWLEARLNLAILYEDYLDDPRQAVASYRAFLDGGGPRRFPQLTNEFFVINAINRLERQIQESPK